MLSRERLSDSVVSKAGPILEGAENAPKGIDWITENPEEFNTKLIPAFALVVLKFNSLVQSDEVPEGLNNINYFRENRITLPRVSELIREFSEQPDKFKEVIKGARHRMDRGSQGHRDFEYYSFHTSPTFDYIPPKAMAAVEIFEISEMLWQEMSLEKPIVIDREGRITDALIETLCVLGEKNPLFELIARDADFVVGYDGFSKELQDRVSEKLNRG